MEKFSIYKYKSNILFFQWPGDSFLKIIIKSLPNKIPLINGIQIFDSSIPNVFLSAKKRGKILSLIYYLLKNFLRIVKLI